MTFEWDPDKNQSNLKKHRVSFADALVVFEDPRAINIPIFEDDEERFSAIGMDSWARMLVVIYTWRDDDIRIISARKANKFEVNQYESQL